MNDKNKDSLDKMNKLQDLLMEIKNELPDDKELYVALAYVFKVLADYAFARGMYESRMENN